METISLPKKEYEKMIEELKLLRKLKEEQESGEVDWDLIRQFKEGLEDVKTGRIRKVA